MKVFIVKIDTAAPSENPNWVIEKVFLEKEAARQYADADPHRVMETHDTVPEFRPLARIESRGF